MLLVAKSARYDKPDETRAFIHSLDQSYSSNNKPWFGRGIIMYLAIIVNFSVSDAASRAAERRGVRVADGQGHQCRS
jgi:hypothetical protein